MNLIDSNILGIICKYLSIKSFYSLLLVSKRFNQLNENDLIWGLYLNKIKKSDKIIKRGFTHKDNLKLIYNLSNLRKRSFQKNSVKDIFNKKKLRFQGWNLMDVPSEIFHLTNLESLRIENYKMVSISPKIGNLINLKTLFLFSNSITEILPEIYSLVNLEHLSFSGNKICEIHREIGNLVNLKRLFLYNNQINIIPSEIGNLINLEELHLETNQIRTLPSEIGNLINLQTLELSNNQIHHQRRSGVLPGRHRLQEQAQQRRGVRPFRDDHRPPAPLIQESACATETRLEGATPPSPRAPT